GDNIKAAVSLGAVGSERSRDGGAAGDRLEAARVAAAAHHLGPVWDGDMAEVPGGSHRAAVHAAFADQAAADARGHLDEQQVVGIGPVAEVLTERHDVDVVIDERDDAEAFGEEALDVEAVPAGHDRWVDRSAGGVFDRSG